MTNESSKEKKFVHIMVDLETLSTSCRSIVLSIGAGVINMLSDGEDETLLPKEFYKVLSQNDQGHREVSQSTLSWWESQSGEAREVLEQSRKAFNKTMEGLETFSAWIKVFKDLGYEPIIWGNGAAFDNCILKDLYEDFGVEVPWSYKADMCYRTLKALYADRINWKEVPKEGAKHNALADAKFQAASLRLMLNEQVFNKIGNNSFAKS